MTRVRRAGAGLVRRSPPGLHSCAPRAVPHTHTIHSPSSAIDDEAEWLGRSGCRATSGVRPPRPPHPPGCGTNQPAGAAVQSSRHQRHGAASGSPPADLLPPRRTRRSGQDSLPVLSQHGDDLERARDSGAPDVLRLPSDDRRVDAVRSGGDQEGPRGVREPAAAAVDSGARAPGLRHQRHIKVLGTEGCNNCHGDVRAMPQVYQVATLRMGWCINCHVQRNVSRDCTVCHY